MRIRPASLMAAALPSSCHETHRVVAISASATSKKGVATSASLAPRLQCLVWVIGGSFCSFDPESTPD